MMKTMKMALLCLILIGCATDPLSYTNSIKNNNYLLGLYPTDITEATTDSEAQAYDLLVCPILPAYDAKTVQDSCHQALVTKSNRPVQFTTVYPEISKRLGSNEFYSLLAPTMAIPPIVAKILHSRNLKIPDLSSNDLKVLMQRSNRTVAGVAALSIATIALLYLFEAHVWGADKRELARLQQDIFAKDDFNQATNTGKSINRLLTLLADNLDLQVSREAKLLFAASRIR